MSWIVLPDEHPGRCRNLRPSAVPYGQMRRCLDYEGTPHVCTFEPENASAGYVMCRGTFSPSTPKPWVKPPAPAPAGTQEETSQ